MNKEKGRKEKRERNGDESSFCGDLKKLGKHVSDSETNR